jgi:HJR/Mrr/RecB family endonuclease
MVLHNNYYIDENGNIHFFKYENLQNFDLASSINEEIHFNSDLFIKLKELDWQFSFNKILPNGTISLKINNITQHFRLNSKDTFLIYLSLYMNLDKDNKYLKNLEKLHKSPESLYSFETINALKSFYENNEDVNFINFMKMILFDFFDFPIDILTDGDNFKHTFWYKKDEESILEKLEWLINFYRDLYNLLYNLLDNNSNNTFIVMLAKENNLYQKYFNFFSKKNKLLLDKYDRLINIEEELYFLNNLIDKNSNSLSQKILDCIENRCLKYIDKLIKENNLLKGIHLLNYLLSFNGSKQLKDFKLSFHSTLMDKFIYYYFKIFYELQEYQIIFDYYHLIRNDTKILQIVSDSYIQISKYDEALKILEKIEIIEPTLKYVQTTRNKISREEKINNFSNKNDKIDNMTGIEFEKLLTDKFNELNFIATQTKGSGDFGADIIVETLNQTKIIIQCKRFTSKVNLKAVQEVIGAVGHFEADIGIVITNNEFLNSAIKLAKSNDIELWDRAKLAKFLNNDISFSILNEV